MPIPQETYFEYSIGALIFLFAGVFLFNQDIDIRSYLKKIDPHDASRLGYLLIVISVAFDILNLMLPSIGSVISFTQYLKYLAAFCFLFGRSKIYVVWIVIIFIQLAVSVLRGGVFLDFMIWATHLFFFIVIRLKISFSLRASFILIAAPLLILIQGVKDEYRKATWEKGREANIGLLSELAIKQGKEDEGQSFLQSKGVVSTVGRLSLGWHLGKTLDHVPKKEPFADGKDMLEDIIGSFIPRVFFSDKKVVGSQEKFYQYTGHRLVGTTSMTIGVLGDFYVNYGYWGSFIMLFVFGAVISKLLYFFMVRYVLNDPINIIWVPYLLNYIIRTNNDFYMGFNSITKGFLIFLFINFIRKKLWPAS